MRQSFHKATTAYVEMDAFEVDKAWRTGLVAGSALLLKALKTGEGPRRFIWNGSACAPNAERYGDAVRKIHEREDYIETLRVSRDPCRVCNTRGDIGCEHRRVA